MTARLSWAAFLLGAAVIAWVGAGYVRHHPLAFTVTALIGLTFVVGAVELHRFRRASAGLARALADLPAELPRLADWLDSAVPAPLRQAVRLRIEGARVPLPGPALTPYLVGLLVLLGMLGTFLGLVVTLDGAVKALETTTDLATIRAALSAPVKGLGLAFGTSVAGVAGSAMLGLMATLARRERAAAGQALDAQAGSGPLRGFSAAALREATLAALQQQGALLQRQHEAFEQQHAVLRRQGEAVQRQAETLPTLVADLHTRMLSQMQALAGQLNQQHAALSQGLLSSQTGFHDDTRRVYGALADSVGASLRDGLAAGARAAGETIQPLAEATMAAIARDTTRLQAEVAATVASQLGAVSTRLDGSVAALDAAWSGALARHGQGSDRLIERLGGLVDGFTARQAEQSGALLAAMQAAQAEGQQALATTLADLARRTQAAQAEGLAATQALHARLTEAAQAQLGSTAERLASQSTALLAGLQQQQLGLVDTLQRSQTDLVAGLQQGQAALHEALAARDQARQQALADALATLSTTLTNRWREAGEETLAQQARLCSLLETSAREIHARADAQTQAAVAEVGRLLQAAGEAPRAAAEAMGALRQALSTSLSQDNAALAERQRLLDTLATLLDAIEQSATRQRGAVDALVASAEALLARTGEQAGRQLDHGAERLDAVAAQVTGSAAEVASLGEAFGVAVDRFTASTEQLGAGLQRIEQALAASMQRSDEQLAYYVAQAREVIDLSLMSQQRLVDELQRQPRAPA